MLLNNHNKFYSKNILNNTENSSDMNLHINQNTLKNSPIINPDLSENVNISNSNNNFNDFRPMKRNHDLSADIYQPSAKRRLIDHMNNLSIGKDNKCFGSSSPNTTASMFGNFSQEQLNRPLNDPNTVTINNIDQFLHENPDQLDIIGEKIQLDDLCKVGLDKLVISCGLDLNKAWDKIITRYKSKNQENQKVDDLVFKLIWEEYLAKYFSLIKYYNPLKTVWNKYVKWLKNKNKIFKSPSIVEILDEDLEKHSNNNTEDYDEMMDDSGDNMKNINKDIDYDDDMELSDDDPEEMKRLAERENSLREGMSGYGSYYTHYDESMDLNNQNFYGAYHSNHFSSNSNSHDLDEDKMMIDD